MIKPGEVLRREDLLIQLAEESAELSQASAKLARHLIGRNPTGKSREEIEKNLEEELADVLVTLAELEYRPEWSVVRFKRERWISRLMRMLEQESGIQEEDDP